MATPPNPPTPSSPPPRPAFAWISLAWCLPGVLAALQYTALCPFPTPAGVPWFAARAVVVSLLLWQIWALFTPLVLRAFERYPLAPLSWRSVAAHLGLAAGCAGVHIAAVVVGRQWLFGEAWWDPAVLRREFGVSLQSRLLLEVTIYGIVLALAEARRQWLLADRHRARLGEVQGELLGAQLEALRGQLQPHFLFNALNAVAVLARAGQNQAAAATVTDLSELLRRSLETGAAAFVPLQDELEFGARYLAIEQRRYGAERLAVTYEVEPAALPAQVPALLLQPLLENAVRHGIQPRVRGGEVRVTGRREADRLKLEISDNGPGPHGADTAGHGIGLTNLRERLRRLYAAEAYRLDARPADSGGFRVELELPFQPAAAAIACVS
ncbi:MAG: histidine kinase [Verrucomicrobia bacterium]|nr:histidine kinase [Verrucomicrobiota bacterium]